MSQKKRARKESKRRRYNILGNETRIGRRENEMRRKEREEKQRGEKR